MGVQSISASATYLLLAFEIKGLAASWYCAPLFTKKIIQNALNLPDSLNPMAFFTVGYPIRTIKAPKRKELDDIIYNLNGHAIVTKIKEEVAVFQDSTKREKEYSTKGVAELV